MEGGNAVSIGPRISNGCGVRRRGSVCRGKLRQSLYDGGVSPTGGTGGGGAVLHRSRNSNDRWRAFAVSAAIVVLLLPMAAYAQAPPAAGGMTLLQAIQASVAGWAGPMRTAAQELLGALGVISLVFAVGWAYMNGDGITGIFAVTLRMVIWLGLVAFIIQGFPAFGNAVVASFQQLGQQAGAVPSSPTDIMGVGTDIGVRIMAKASILHPAAAAALMIAAAFAACCFYLVAALMLLAIAKAYVVIAASTVFLGFAGHEFTMPAARGVFFAVVGAGARVMTIQLLAGIGATMVRAWMGDATALDDAGMFTMMGLALVYVVIIFSIPAAVEGIANGHGGHSRAGPSDAVRAIGQTVSVGSSVTSATLQLSSRIGSAGSAAMGLLTGSSNNGGSTLSSGGGASASGSAGSRMAPQGARFTRSP
jgi:type IV secretion system protein TrbL